MKKILAIALLVLSIPAFAQVPVACSPQPVGQSICKLSWDVAIDPNIRQFLLVPDIGAPVSAGLPATKTTNTTTGLDTYTTPLPLTIVPVENTPHTVRVEACQGTTAANATNCSPASPPSPPFTSGLAAVTVAPRLSTSP